MQAAGSEDGGSGYTDRNPGFKMNTPARRIYDGAIRRIASTHRDCGFDA
jgi:hypothetical protein